MKFGIPFFSNGVTVSLQSFMPLWMIFLKIEISPKNKILAHKIILV
jgi:hypothetical protein